MPQLKEQAIVRKIAIISTCAALFGNAAAQDQTHDSEFSFKAQATFIDQHLFPFNSPYAGSHSLISKSDSEISQTFTLFLGARLGKRLEFYADPEDARGGGISNSVGVAGFPNGETTRLGVDEFPNVVRYFLRYTVPVGQRVEMEHVSQDENQIAGSRPIHRIVMSVGAMAVTDFFDTNAYANSARSQFLNWDLVNNAAYDYAADTRGYSSGAVVEYIQPTCQFRFGSFVMPASANGQTLSGQVNQSRGDQAELDFQPRLMRKHPPATVRLFSYRNVADMGNYREALALAKETGSVPDITAVRHPGNVKYGFGTSFDQGLADPDEDPSQPWKTGLFFRAGWNDDSTESFAYTEAQSSLSAGIQVCGSHWRAKNDLLGFALAQNGLSAAHRDYLAAGGVGFQVGDGRLNYGQERLLETYYNHPFGPHATLGADIQLIENPGYNQDRGPVAVAAIRLHFEF